MGESKKPSDVATLHEGRAHPATMGFRYSLSQEFPMTLLVKSNPRDPMPTGVAGPFVGLVARLRL